MEAEPVEHGDADGEAAARRQEERGLQREHGAARRKRRHERGDPGDLPRVVGGEAVDAVRAAVVLSAAVKACSCQLGGARVLVYIS